MRFRIYALTEPGGNPRYVGQTTQPLGLRLRDHIGRRGHSARANWVKALTANNLEPQIVQLEEIDGTRKDAYARETHWIRELRSAGHNLLNVP